MSDVSIDCLKKLGLRNLTLKLTIWIAEMQTNLALNQMQLLFSNS